MKERWGDREINEDTAALLERLDTLTDALLQVADVFRRQLALAEQALLEHETHRRHEDSKLQ